MHKIDLRIIGAIDQDAYKLFSKQLSALEEAHPAVTGMRGKRTMPEVEVELYSEGGSAYSALAFCHRIRTSHLTINVTTRGVANSAAILVLAAFDHRRMANNATAMVHEDQLSDVSGPLNIVQKEIDHATEIERIWSEELATLTTTTANMWAALHRETTYMTAQECLDYGLIDEIV